MRIHYFAEDGNYGSADGLVIVDTSDWTEDEWEIIDGALDCDRPIIARSLSKTDPDQLELPLG